jgi:hypothetical protein
MFKLGFQYFLNMISQIYYPNSQHTLFLLTALVLSQIFIQKTEINIKMLFSLKNKPNTFCQILPRFTLQTLLQQQI